VSDHNNPVSLDEAFTEIERLRGKIAELEATTRSVSIHSEPLAQSEPIAIVGMGCRFPGDVSTPEEFWDLLSSGRDVLREIPSSRWDVDAYYDPEISVPGKMYVRKGHYLDNVDQFDPQFFGLSPREAASLDPQQRLLLEVSWEALEHAGIAASSLKGSKTGVFVGQYWDDYSMQRIYANDLRKIDRYAQLSGLRGLSAGRIAHILDSHGPAMQLDTACSSASLAVHLACQSLRSRESSLALAGGVSLILAPEHLIGICQMKALSADGRCKTFDASADGFGQGEGCGMVALKRLADAQADGDNVWAVIRGSAVNHDGHARTVTTPSGPAQRAMLQEALANAGLAPGQLDFIETHGTGTPLGDPIEVLAIARVLCEDRDAPLHLGSVKTNVGHLDAAAGIVGLMKVVLSLQHKAIPPSLNFTEPNPRIPWDEWPLSVPTELIPWEAEERFAGISAFGMSGTNVHLIVGQAPEVAIEPQPAVCSHHVLALSAQTQATLPDVARTYAAYLQSLPQEDAQSALASVCYTTTMGRTHFPHRLAVVAESASEMQAQLAGFAEGKTPKQTFCGATGRRAPKTAFLFTGQGSQFVGMGRQLYDAQPTFRYWLDQCAQILTSHLDKPLLDVMWAGDDLHQTAYTQPALFALEYALAKLWEEWGVEPDLLLGHSIGEYAAACIANVFSLEAGLKLVAARGRLMQSLPAGGEMVSVVADEAAVNAHINNVKDSVSIAAVNGPQSIVISGRGDAVQGVVAGLRDHGIKTTQLKVSHAFHSPLMEPILAQFRAVASEVTYSEPTKTVVSNVTGQALSGDLLTPEYWVQHLRGAVRFADGMAEAVGRKIETFVEIGPRPTLLGLGRSCTAPDYGVWLPSLKPKQEWVTLASSVAELHVRGVGVTWSNFQPQRPKKAVLPSYPWRRQRYWTDVISTAPTGPVLHPLVHRRISTAASTAIFESTLSSSEPAYLADHLVFGGVVFPASAYFEMALAAGCAVTGHAELELTNVSIRAAMLLTESPVSIQVIVTPDGQNHRFEIFSKSAIAKSANDDTWVCHVVGTLGRSGGLSALSQKRMDAEVSWPQNAPRMDLETFNARFSSRGVAYGPAFQAIVELGLDASDSSVAVARIELPKQALAARDANAYGIHPVLLDASLRVQEALFPNSADEEIFLPFAIGALRCTGIPDGPLWVKAEGTEHERTRVINIGLFDQDGHCVAQITDFTLRAVSVLGLRRASSAKQSPKEFLSEWLYELRWEPAPRAELSSDERFSGGWLLLGDSTGVATQLADELELRGADVCIVSAGPSYARVDQNHFEVNRAARSEFDRLVAQALSGQLSGVIQLWGLDANERNYGDVLSGTLHIVQALKAAGKIAPLWLGTRGAQVSASDTGSINSLWQAPVWGFGRTLQVEHPEFACICVDIESGSDGYQKLLEELLSSDGENQVAYRSGERHVARLSHAQFAASESSELRLDASASYLVTGGLGALGLEVAQFLVASGAKHLLLTGRSGVATAGQKAAISRLEDSGAHVVVVPADVSSAADVARVLNSVSAPLRGIVHAAGVLDDGMITQQSADRFDLVAGPKVGGAWQLHSQTLEHQLDFFVLFSSVASVMGSAGQSNYAAANAFMDALAHYRRQSGLPALSVNWGPWADVGMAAAEPVMRRLMNDGWHPITPEQGCEVIAQLVSDGSVAQAGVIPVDWSVFSGRVPGAAKWPLLAELVVAADEAEDAGASTVKAIAEQAKASSAEQRLALVTSYLLERIAQTLRVPVSDLDEQEAPSNLGIDSLTAVELTSWVLNDLNIELPMEQMFTAPSIADLAVAINDALAGGSPDGVVVAASDGGLATASAKWIVRPQPKPEARLRLFCFPYAGGGASTFRDWNAAVSDDIEVCVMQLPGREERLQESPMTDMPTLLDALTQEVLALADKPFAFFGHSMGAVLSFEVARRLRAAGDTQPMHLILSSRAAPQLVNNDESMRFLPDTEFLEKLHGLYGAVPQAIRENAKLREIFLPILKADVTLLETHDYVPGAPLGCPISVFGGGADPSISNDMLLAWREHTEAEFAHKMFPGDHFYLVPGKDAVIREVMALLL
jgi:acyl transferase domain-containing protein/surfactin synthase thioesterase subunit